MAEDVAAFARALGLDAPLICGYGDGGNVAVEVGMRFPELPKALAVGAAWHEFSETYVQGVRSALHVDEGGEADPDRMERENPQFAGFLREAQQAQGPEHWKTLVPEDARGDARDGTPCGERQQACGRATEAKAMIGATEHGARTPARRGLPASPRR